MDAQKFGLRKRGVLLSLGVVAGLVLWSAPAQALEWLPVKTAVLGKTTNSRFEYSGNVVACESEIGGSTAGVGSPIIPLTAMAFKACAITGFSSAEMSTTAGTKSFPLVATSTEGKAGNGLAHIEIPNGGAMITKLKGFFGTVLCELKAAGAQNMVKRFDAEADVLIIDTTLAIERTVGTEAECGPKNGTGTYEAVYAMQPTSLVIK